jgi:NAD(P)-dependent dehydrogenase (short-subunit alcohol dehydrogenase family)
LSTGGKAGIGVGAVLGFVALGALLILLLLRRKKKLQHPTVPEMDGQPSGFKRFLGGKWRAEAEAKSEPVEIDSRGIKVIPGPPVELEAAR